MRWSWIAIGVLGLTATTGGTHAKDWSKRVPTPAERGEALYVRHCVACHGERAAGDGPLAASLVVPVPNLQEALTDRPMDELVEAVMVGRGAMPGFARSFEELYPRSGDFDDFARSVVDHMRGLGPEDEASAPKREAKPKLTQEEIDEENEAARD